MKDTRRIMVDAIAYDEAVKRVLADSYKIAKGAGMPSAEAEMIRMMNATCMDALRVLLFEDTPKTGGQNYEQYQWH